MKNKDTWIYKVFFMAFFLAVLFSSASNYIANEFNSIVLIVIIVIVILIGIIFDIVGVSVLSATEATYHAKAAQKVKGAKESVDLLKNAPKVSNFCNDVIGDICGIVSGGLGAVLALELSLNFSINPLWFTIGITSLISATTVGGKAIGKNIASAKCGSIVFAVGKILSIFKKK